MLDNVGLLGGVVVLTLSRYQICINQQDIAEKLLMLRGLRQHPNPLLERRRACGPHPPPHQYTQAGRRRRQLWNEYQPGLYHDASNVACYLPANRYRAAVTHLATGMRGKCNNCCTTIRLLL